MIFLSPEDQPVWKPSPLGKPSAASPQKAEPPELSPLDVIFVGAHPDDVEIACGGTIHRLSQQGYRVGIVDLTDGEPTPISTDPAVRWEESRIAAQTLGIAYRRVMNLPNRRLMDCFEHRAELAKEFRFWKPKLVVSFGHKTPMASPDHFQAMLITDAAVFYSRLTKWDQHFDQIPPHTIQKQIYFQLSFGMANESSICPQITVDISESLDAKLAAIQCYKTQFPAAKESIFDRVRGLAIAAGAAAGIQAGEVFALTRPIVVQDLPKALLDL